MKEPIYITIIRRLAWIIAKIVESSGWTIELFRKLTFKGKVIVAAYIRPEKLPNQLTAECDGINYSLKLKDDVQRHIYFNIYEHKDIKSILELIPPGGVCFDVGANVGFYALNFAKRVGTGGLVHAFEPDPKIYLKLTENCKLNDFAKSIQVNQVAVTDKDCKVTLYQSEDTHTGWGSLVEYKEIVAGKVEVDGITLDHFIKLQGISHIDMMKVDVEANEFELLDGAQEALKKHLFKFVLIEFNGIRLAQRGKSFADFLKKFSDVGYEPVKMRLEMIDAMTHGRMKPEDTCTNFLFAPIKS